MDYKSCLDLETKQNLLLQNCLQECLAVEAALKSEIAALNMDPDKLNGVRISSNFPEMSEGHALKELQEKNLLCDDFDSFEKLEMILRQFYSSFK
jgi:hypothetical protein